MESDFFKLGCCMIDHTINDLQESKYTFLDAHVGEHCFLDYLFRESALSFHSFHVMEGYRTIWKVIGFNGIILDNKHGLVLQA